MAVFFIKIQHEQFVNLSWTIEIRSLISWVFSAEFCSVVCNLFSLLFVCLTVPERTPSPQLLLRTNSLHFLSRVAFSLSDVYVVVVICCHSSSAVFHPWLGLQSWQECSPQDPGVERLFQSNINIWPPLSARVKILAWRPRKLQTEQTGFLFLPLQGEKLMSALCSNSPLRVLHHPANVLFKFLNPPFCLDSAMLSFSSCVIIDNTLIWRVSWPPATDLHQEWDCGRPARRMHSHLLQLLLSVSWQFLSCAWESPLMRKPNQKKVKHLKIPPLLVHLVRSVGLPNNYLSSPAACSSERVCGRVIFFYPVPLSRGGWPGQHEGAEGGGGGGAAAGGRAAAGGGGGAGGYPGRAEVPGCPGFASAYKMVPGELIRWSLLVG